MGESGQMIKYDPISGKFTKKGKSIGWITVNGYQMLWFQGKQQLAHRVAFFLMEGSFPEEQVDHIDRNRSNNKWANLRKVTPQQNNFNRSCKRDLPLGVYERVRKGRPGIWYETRIQKDRKTHSSYFRSLEKAIEWRKKKERELFGEIVQQW